MPEGKELKFQLVGEEQTTIQPIEFNLEPISELPGAAVRMIPFEQGDREVNIMFVDYIPPSDGVAAVAKIEIKQDKSKNPEYIWDEKDVITLHSGITIPLNTIIGFKVILDTTKNLFRGEFVLI